MSLYNVHLSDEAWYENIEAENEEEAICRALEWFNERKAKIEIEEVKTKETGKDELSVEELQQLLDDRECDDVAAEEIDL